LVYKLDDICQQGDFLNAFMFHISGMNWAATNSAELKAMFDAGDSQAADLRGGIFSNYQAEVQVLQILDNNLGSQTISYDENKGLNIGGWGVRLFSNPSGYQFGNGVNVNSHGIMGLDWQPNLTTQGFAYSVLGADLDCDTSTSIGFLEWPKDKDFGLKSWIDDNYSGGFTSNLALWVGSACVILQGYPTTNGNNWRAQVACQVWNSVNEFIPQRVDQQNIYVTNFPQSIQGQTASLWGYSTSDFFVNPKLNTTVNGYLLRHGKVKPNSRIDTSGTWNINVGSATDNFKFKLKRNSFRGHLSGYLFRADDYEGYNTFGELGYNVWHRPHVYMQRIEVNSSGIIQSASYYSGDLNSGAEFLTTDLSFVKDKLASTLNTIGPSGCKFSVAHDGITYEDTNESGGTKYYYLVSGPAIKVCGGGYISRPSLQDYLYECTSRNPIWLKPEQRIATLSAERWFQTGDVHVSLRRSDEDSIDDMNNRPYYDGRELNNAIAAENHEFTEAKGWCAYYYPFPTGDRPTVYDLESPETALFEQTEKIEPLSTTNDTFFYTSTNESTLIAGDIIQFGESGGDAQIFCKVDETDLTSSTFNSSNALITGMGYGFIWNRGIQEALVNDSGYRSTVQYQFSTHITVGLSPAVTDHVGKTASDFYAEKQVKDTFELIGKSSTMDEDPVDVLKALVGDPSSTLDIPESIKQTSIGYLFSRGSAGGINRSLIDWDSLSDVISNAQYDGVTYTFPFFSNDNDSLDLIELIQGLLNTHGGKMIYVWDEDARAFKISFLTGLNTSIPEAVIAGREFKHEDIAENITPAIDGGDWSYNRIAAEYKNRDGGMTPINISLQDSRIQHTLQDKIFKIKDPFTVLNVSADDFKTQVIDKLSSLLQTLSTVQYTQEVPLKVKSFARVTTGVGHLFSWEGLLNRETGIRGEDVFGDVKKVVYDLSKMKVSAFVSTKTIRAIGYAPSMAATVSGTPGTSSMTVSFNTATSAQEFQNSDNGLTDAGYFDCYSYISANQTIETRNCNCSDYGVVFFIRRENDCRFDPAYADVNQNVYRGTISVPLAAATLDNGSQNITITYDTPLATASGHNVATKMPNGTEIIILFENRAGNNIQDCQTRLYGWNGNTNGQVTDSSGSKHLAITVGN
jgi:hypothetical protein